MKQRILGVREAKDRFSALVRDAALGREWVITQRGRPIVKIVPAETSAATLAARIGGLEAAGALEPLPASARPLPPPLPLPEEGLALRILDQDRGA